MIRPYEYESISKADALELSNKLVKASINIWGENSIEHLRSVDTAAFFSSYFDKQFGSNLFLKLEKIGLDNFSAEPGILSDVYYKIAYYWRIFGDNSAYNEYIEKYLRARFSYYKNVLAYMGTEQRLNQIQADESVFNMIYADAASERLSSSVAVFALLIGMVFSLSLKDNIIL